MLLKPSATTPTRQVRRQPAGVGGGICGGISRHSRGPNLMFENLTDKLQRVFKNLRGQGKLTQEHVDEALAGIREALLEGDVNVGVADELLAHIREKALGSEVLLQLSPDRPDSSKSYATNSRHFSASTRPSRCSPRGRRRSG